MKARALDRRGRVTTRALIFDKDDEVISELTRFAGTERLSAAHFTAYLEFNCRIGHRFSAHETFIAKEQTAEDNLWAAVLGFEEIAALAHDLAAHAIRYGWPEASAYHEREASAMAQAAAVRQLVADHRPIALPSPETAAATYGARVVGVVLTGGPAATRSERFPPTSREDGSRRPAENLAQIVLRRLQATTIERLQRPSGPIDVEIRHRHGGLGLRACLGWTAAIHRPIESSRDLARGAREDSSRQIHGVGHFLNPPHPPC
jgi:hypothetical protein